MSACVESSSLSNSEPDFEVVNTPDSMQLSDASGVDQRLYEARLLQIVCSSSNETGCETDASVLTVETGEVFELSVKLLESEVPEEGTIVSFAFVDSMGIDIPSSVIDGVELQALSAVTDERGLSTVRVMAGVIEADVTIRALVPGLRTVEWTVSVRREQVGTLEIETVYQPGSQSQGTGSFDMVNLFLLPDDGIEGACENFKADPGTLAIHAVREESGGFEVTSDNYSSLVVFNSTDSDSLYIAVGLVKDTAGTLIGFGCIRALSVEAEEISQYDMIITDVEVPLDYKGSYKVSLRLDLSGILNVQPETLNEEDSVRLGRSIIFENFRNEVFRFSDGTDDRSRVLMRLFCDFVPFEGEECSQVESYIVRGLLGPLIDEVIAVEAPLFFHAVRLYGEALMLLSHIDVDVLINIRNRSPDSFGSLTSNDIRWSRMGFLQGDQCNFSTHSDSGCQWRWFPVFELHLDHAGTFLPLRGLFDAQISGNSLLINYHELTIHFGLIVTKLLERWSFPTVFSIPEDTSLLNVLRAVLPCLPVDQFVGDDPFCEPFLLTNIEYIFREMLARYNFGGFNLGFSGEATVVDRDGDRIVEEFIDGTFDVYLPEIVDDSIVQDDTANDDSPEMMEAGRESRRTSLIKSCFSACRCIAEPCVCVPRRCVP